MTTMHRIELSTILADEYGVTSAPAAFAHERAQYLAIRVRMEQLALSEPAAKAAFLGHQALLDPQGWDACIASFRRRTDCNCFFCSYDEREAQWDAFWPDGLPRTGERA
jgi:hypothetical protein